jgi:hypothetical protein
VKYEVGEWVACLDTGLIGRFDGPSRSRRGLVRVIIHDGINRYYFAVSKPADGIRRATPREIEDETCDIMVSELGT